MRCSRCFRGELQLWKMQEVRFGPQPRHTYQCPVCGAKLLEFTSSKDGEPLFLDLSNRDPDKPLGEWIMDEFSRQQQN